MLQLTTLASRYIEKLGREKVAEVTGLSPSQAASLAKLGKFPVAGLEKLLAHDAFPITELQPSAASGVPEAPAAPLWQKMEMGTKLVVLMPCNGNPEGRCLDTLIPLLDRKEMDFRRYGFNNLHVVRNALAAQFLAGPWEWSFWLDADSVVPCGHADTYYRASGLNASQMPEMFASVHAIYRLLVHKKNFIGGTYFAKRKGGSGQFGGSETREVQQEIRSGPKDRIREVPWIGFGGVLVHRRVFEDIIHTQGDELKHNNPGLKQRFGYDHCFFSPVSHQIPGDDLSFCHRASLAGHKPHVDLAVQIAHVGPHAYTWLDA